jgi:hypothetical protein
VKTESQADVAPKVHLEFCQAALERRRTLINPIRRAMWNLAVATEISAPGLLDVFPVLQGREIVDFEFLAVCPAATAFLGATPGGFVNRTVRQLFDAGLEADKVVEAYRRTMESGRPLIHVGAGCSLAFGSAVLHFIRRVGSGLSVVLSCPDAIAREAEARSVLLQLQTVPFVERRVALKFQHAFRFAP